MTQCPQAEKPMTKHIGLSKGTHMCKPCPPPMGARRPLPQDEHLTHKNFAQALELSAQRAATGLGLDVWTSYPFPGSRINFDLRPTRMLKRFEICYAATTACHRWQKASCCPPPPPPPTRASWQSPSARRQNSIPNDHPDCSASSQYITGVCSKNNFDRDCPFR